MRMRVAVFEAVLEVLLLRGHFGGHQGSSPKAHLEGGRLRDGFLASAVPPLSCAQMPQPPEILRLHANDAPSQTEADIASPQEYFSNGNTGISVAVS